MYLRRLVSSDWVWYNAQSKRMAKSKSKDEPKGPRVIENRRARFDYEITETLEAGIVLVGSEVKSLFLGRANLTDAYVKVQGGELWLLEFDIEPYEFAHHYKPERRRERKLLAHRKQIETVGRKAQEKGLALIPLRIFFKNGKAKVEVGLGRGKRQYDKREQLKKDEERREVEKMRGARRQLD